MDDQTFIASLKGMHQQRGRGEISLETLRDAELILTRQFATDRGARPADFLRSVLALENSQ